MCAASVARSTLLTHFDYTLWASTKLLDAASRLSSEELTRDLKCSHASILQTLQHIYYADRVWLARLEERQIDFADPAPGPMLDELKERWPAVIRQIRTFVENASEELMEQPLHFRRLNGDRHSVTHWKILFHIVNHATLHRGQVMAMLRQIDHVPPGTDYLFYHLNL